jgi:chromosome partitioning protein
LGGEQSRLYEYNLRIRDVTIGKPVARILAIANQKGGVGKTTTALNLGVALSRQQRRVLLVDLDPQASLTTFLGLNPYGLRRTSYSLLMFPEMSLSRVLVPIVSGLALVPSSIDLSVASIKLVQGQAELERLRRILRESRVTFDYIVIDTPPGLDVLTAVGLIAADEVIIPVQCSHLAMFGVRATQEAIGRISEGARNPNLKLRGILPTLYDENTAYAREVLNELRAVLPVFETVIPYDPYVADAPHNGKPVIDYAPESTAAVAYLMFTAEIMGSEEA